MAEQPGDTSDDGWTTFESPTAPPPPPAPAPPHEPPAAPTVHANVTRPRSRLGAATPTPETPSTSSSTDGWAVATGLFGFLAVTLWIVTALQAQSNRGAIDDTFGASAPQISQLVDESFAQLMPYVAWSIAVTVLAMTTAALGLMRRR